MGMGSFITYILRRLLMLLFVLIGISCITFIVARVVPADPAASYLGPRPKPEQVEMIRVQLGLDKPIIVQYGIYMRDLLHGDMGKSIRTHQPVAGSILQYLPASLELMFTAIILALVVGITVGTCTANRENSLVDHTGRIFAISGVSLPGFWLGLLFQILFFRLLGILPLGGRIDTYVQLSSPIRTITGFNILDALITGNWTAFKDAVLHIILPACTLAAYSTGLITRMVRATMLDVNCEEYVQVARAIGYSRGTVSRRFSLRNSLTPALTTAGLAFASMLTGTFFVETIFYWPGLGTYTVQAIQLADYPVIMGVTLIGAVFYVLVNLVVDIIVAILDPRIRL